MITEVVVVADTGDDESPGLGPPASLRRALPRTVQSIHLSTLTAAQADGCELFCSDSGRTKELTMVETPTQSVWSLTQAEPETHAS